MNYWEKLFHTCAIAWGVAFMLAFSGVAQAQEPSVVDHYKTVIVQHPQRVEVCQQGNRQSDLSNFLSGALIGGAIGNNIPGEKGGGTIGALIGGAMNTERNKGQSCRVETRYHEEQKTVYSHSTITFNYQGKLYSVNFKK